MRKVGNTTAYLKSIGMNDPELASQMVGGALQLVDLEGGGVRILDLAGNLVKEIQTQSKPKDLSRHTRMQARMALNLVMPQSPICSI